MLVNLSNHNSSLWSEQQTNAASQYGKIIDIPFPNVDPNGDKTYIRKLAEEYSELVLQIIKVDQGTSAVHIMGEMTATFAIVSLLQTKGIKCIASTTARMTSTSTHNSSTKISSFNFVRFREY